jgi:hypothetical protein
MEKHFFFLLEGVRYRRSLAAPSGPVGRINLISHFLPGIYATKK